jgi:hypothetical protein
LKFNAPQNFASYRQSELDTTRIGAFTQLEALPYMSKRFLLQRFLGLTEEEIQENEDMWREERDDPEMSTNAGQDLRSIGITPGSLEADIETGESVAGMEPMGAGAPPVQNFAMGGRVESFNEYVSPGMGASSGGFAIGSPSGDMTGKKDDIPIKVSGGEYIIPKHVVDMKGKEFFDTLLDKYNPDNAKA